MTSNDIITRNISLNGDDIEEKREEILKYFTKTYDIFEKVFDIFVDDNVFYEQPERLRHPLIFYFGHTATFFINKLILGKYITTRVNPKFESMFAIGVDEMSWDDLNDTNYSWPRVEEVREYRKKIKDLISDFIKTCEFSLPIKWNSPMWTVIMGIEHEKIHIETSSVLHRQLDIKFVKESAIWPICQDFGNAPTNTMLEVPHCNIKLGKDHNSEYYGWDNEYGSYEEFVPDFKASKYLVSNGEFLEFVDDGGYEKTKFWSLEGKNWLAYTKAKFPTFWIKSGDGFKYRSLTKIIQMPYNWPVDVNFLEAEAFCNWKSEKENKKITMPTEAMWYRLRDFCKVKDEKNWETKAPANINLEYFASSVPVDRFAFGDFFDVIGNVWQWTTTPIDAFDGFEVHPLYDDFSVPTFDGRHNLIKGGSWISTGNEILKEARYAFRRHFFQHAGFRYVEYETKDLHQKPYYENNKILSEYCEFHYGENYFGVTNFHKKAVDETIKLLSDKKFNKALDLGCNVGRATFELSKYFDNVIGIDFTARTIRLAEILKTQKSIRYKLAQEGDLVLDKEVSLKDLDLDDLKTDNIEFWQGDACNLKPHFKDFDLVFCANLIDRLYDPQKFLNDISNRLNSKGILVLGSPYTWSEEYTKKELWLGGKVVDKKNITTKESINEILNKNFIEISAPIDIEFVIRETSRKFQHTISQFSFWEKR